MKILAILGSPRKGNTFHAVQKIEKAMRACGEVEFEYLMLKDTDLAPCTGCFACFLKGEDYCPRKDNAPGIEQKMHDADGVIFASPVYGMNVPGLFKTFIDRFSYIFHRPRFFGKKALLLATAGAIGTKEVLSYLRTVAGTWGFDIAGSVGINTPPFGYSEPARKKNEDCLIKSGNAFYTAVEKRQRVSPGLMNVLTFHSQRAVFDEYSTESPFDYHYWKKHGWLDPGAQYYVDIPVNPVYNVIGRIAEWYMRRQIRKEKQNNPAGRYE